MSIGHSYGCSSGSCVWVDWGFGDFQSLKTTPGEHPQQPIEPSHLGREGLVCCPPHSRPSTREQRAHPRGRKPVVMPHPCFVLTALLAQHNWRHAVKDKGVSYDT